MRLRLGDREVEVTRTTVRRAIAEVRPWLRAEVASQPIALQRLFAGLTALIVIGAGSAALAAGPGIEAVNTTPVVEWGVLIAAYVFLVVTTSGLCLVSSLGMVFGIDRFKPVEMRHVVLALLFLLSGFGVIALDLHYPLRLLLGVVLSPAPTSPMWWMGMVYGVYLAVLVFELLANLSRHPRLAHLACYISSGMAVVAPSTLGMVFGSLVSRPFWQGSIVPLYLVLTALLSGASVLGMSFAIVERFRLPGHGPDARGVIAGIDRLLVVLVGLVTLYTLARTGAAVLIGSPAERAAVAALAVGPLGPQSWLLRVVLGLVLPLLILVWPGRRRAARVFVASGLVLVGVFFDRLGFVTAGEIAPQTAASGIVSGPYASYVPSPAEIGIVIGAVSVVALLYLLAERFVDLSSPGGPGDVHSIRASGSRRILRRSILGLGPQPRSGGLERQPQAGGLEG